MRAAVRQRRPGDATWRRVRQAQIPIGIAGVIVGAWEAATGDVLLGVLLVAISVAAAGLALMRLRSGRR
jgi:hypothetical protein